MFHVCKQMWDEIEWKWDKVVDNGETQSNVFM